MSEQPIGYGETVVNEIYDLLIQRICMAFKGLFNPNKVAMAIKVKAATLVLSWNVKKF